MFRSTHRNTQLFFVKELSGTQIISSGNFLNSDYHSTDSDATESLPPSPENNHDENSQEESIILDSMFNESFNSQATLSPGIVIINPRQSFTETVSIGTQTD